MNSKYIKLLLGGVLFIGLILVVSNIVSLGNALYTIHPFLIYIYYSGVLLGTWFLIFSPIIKIFSHSTIDQLFDIKNIDKTHQLFIKRGFISNPENQLTDSQKMEAVSVKTEELFNDVDNVIHQQAKLVFASSAISQNSNFDSLIVLVYNFQLIQTIVETMGFRPSKIQLLKIASRIFTATFIAQQLEDILEQSNITESILPNIMQDIPFVNLVTKSTLNGSLNAFLTLRIGYITKYYLQNSSNFNVREAKRFGRSNALSEIKSVIADASKDLGNNTFSKVKNIFTKKKVKN